MNSPTIALGARLTAVRLKNQAEEEIGKVIEWLMDVEQGRVIYVVAEFNDTDEYYAIPWGIMKADLATGGYYVDEEQIKRYDLRIDRDLLNDLVSDKDFLNRVFETYHMPKYWEENESVPMQQSNEVGQSPAGQEAGEAANAETGEGKGYGG